MEKRGKAPILTIIFIFFIVVIVVAFVTYGFFDVSGTVQENKSMTEKIGDCSNYEGNRDMCFLKLASETGDLTYCENILGHDEYYFCLEKEWENEGCFFEELIGGNVDLCRVNYAVDSEDIDVCGLISDTKIKEDCVIDIANLAISLNNVSLCKGIAECEHKVFFDLKQYDRCVTQGCFDYIVSSIRNSSGCKDFSRADSRYECYVNFGITNISDMADSELNLVRLNLYETIKNNDCENCEKFSSLSFSDYKQVSSKYDFTLSDYCYFACAESFDKSYCSNIIDTFLKSSCNLDELDIKNEELAAVLEDFSKR